MASLWHFAAIACGVVFPINEASANVIGNAVDSGAREMSRGEIMAGMTSRDALKLVMKRVHNDAALSSVIQEASGQLVGVSGRHNQTEQAQGALRGSQDKSSDAFDDAIHKLNEMTEDAQHSLDTESQRCKIEVTQMTTEMSFLQNQVKRHNAGAASARASVLIAQGNIATMEELLNEISIKFEMHKEECIREQNALNAELKIILTDIQVMSTIIGLIECEASSASSGQRVASSASSSFVQCAHCDNGIMLQHDKIQQALSKLKSQVARDFVKKSMVKPGVFLEEGFRVSSPFDEIGGVPLPVGGVNVSDVPLMPVAADCIPTTKCTITGNPNCQKLLDRFLVCQAGITDRKAELEEDLSNSQQYCKEQSESFTEQIGGINTRLRKERGDLALGIQRQNENEEGSHQMSTRHAEVATQYMIVTKTCCDNKNTARSELCALEKIRGEVAKIKSKDINFIDCAVTDWSDEECSATCGGGTMTRVRSIITQPQGGGVPCPPLQALVSCNQQTCPVDCHVNDWEGWSSCSAECGGGVKERTRSIIIEANYGGEPCEDTEAEEACNIQDCDEPCELEEWSQWSSCSKMCGGGTQRRTKSIRKAAVGNGHCAEPTDTSSPFGRLAFKPCNDFMCTEFLPPQRNILRCESKVDVVILLDSSASLGSQGWVVAHKFVSNVIRALADGISNSTDVKLGLQLFSGPKTWEAYKECTQSSGTQEIDMKEVCGIQWYHHLSTADTNVTLKTLADEVDAFTEDNWLKSTTLTSVALGQAENELFQGREDANSVVLVITDGLPMSQRNTRAAALRLQEKAKVVWVPIGESAPRELVESLASAPQKDHVVQIRDFQSLLAPWAVNQLVSITCPRVA